MDKFIDEYNGEILVWDFRLSEDEPKNTDTTAVAVMLCVINEMSKLNQNQIILEFEKEFPAKIQDGVDLSMGNNGILKKINWQESLYMMRRLLYCRISGYKGFRCRVTLIKSILVNKWRYKAKWITKRFWKH